MKSVFKSSNKLILPAYSLTKKCMEISLENLYVDIRVQNRGWGGGGPCLLYTVEPRFNKRLSTKVLGITNDFLQLGQNNNKLCGTENLNKMNFDLTKSLL